MTRAQASEQRPRWRTRAAGAGGGRENRITFDLRLDLVLIASGTVLVVKGRREAVVVVVVVGEGGRNNKDMGVDVAYCRLIDLGCKIDCDLRCTVPALAWRI
jgi:hypothetical protein